MDKFQAFLATLFMSLLATSCSDQKLFINNDKCLMKYLCSPNAMVSPNTEILLNKSSFTISGRHSFCLIENTSNITITPDPNGHNLVKIRCLNGSGGFSFFNVTNLTISSVMFSDCAGFIPASAVRYVNGTDQYLRYVNGSNQYLNYEEYSKAAFIFNHCNNIKLNNLITNQTKQSYREFSIIGVNLCDHSSIRIITSSVVVPEMKTLVYYTDSNLTNSSSKCILNIEYNSTFEIPHNLIIKEQFLFMNNIKKISVARITDWFTLLLSQQNFNPIINMIMKPTISTKVWTGPKLRVSVIFAFSNTDSQVTFQGIPYEYCLNESIPSIDHYFMPLPLAVFYFNSRNGFESVSDLFRIQNTAFVTYTHSESGADHYVHKLLRIVKVYDDMISHQIVMENTSCCVKELNSGYSNEMNSYYMIHGEYYHIEDSHVTKLRVQMTNIHMDYLGPSPLLNTPIKFANANVTMNGTIWLNINSVIIWSSNLTIEGNLNVRGTNSYNKGGGISLDESSTLFLKEPLEAKFYNNRAIRGSAIYAPGKNPIQILPNQKYSLHNITKIKIALHFKNNTDHSNNPNSLYAPSLLSASQSHNFMFDDRDHNHTPYTTLFDVILRNMSELDKFTSLPNGLCWQLNGMKWKCDYTNIYSDNDHYQHYVAHFHTYPGEKAISIFNTYDYEFNVQQVSCSEDTSTIKSLDSLIKRKYPIIWVTLQNKNKKELCTTIVHQKHVSYYGFYAYVDAHCPPGFSLSEEGYCNNSCTPALHNHGYRCDIDSRIFSSPKTYWTGYKNSSNKTVILFINNCPLNYCDPEFNNFTLNDSITDLSCLNYRTGILCGRCKEDYSAVFGSDTCSGDCTDLYLLTLPMYVLAGLILVVLLFALRLTVATGTINGVIFYANMVSLSMDQLTQDHKGSYSALSRVIISLFNLDLGFPLCFYKGMTTTAKVGFQFMFPVYIWSIVIGMIIISNYSVRISNLIAKSSVQVLATLLYLSYSKLLRTVIDVLTYSTLHSITYDLDNSYTISEQTVWYYNGEDHYSHGVHVFCLFLATAFTVLFLLPYTVLVTFSYCFMRFKSIHKFKPLIDAYCGPFKDKWRFWFGLRLWIAITFSILSAVDSVLLLEKYTETVLIIHFFVITIFIFLQAFCRPFKSLLICLIDIFFMVNYWLMVAVHLLFGSISAPAYIFLSSTAILLVFLILLFHWFHNCVYLNFQNSFFKIKRNCLNRFNSYEVIEEANEGEEELFTAARVREQEIRDTES